jgi:hypothetical protein
VKEATAQGTTCVACVHACEKFTDEGITVEEKINKNVELAKKMGMSEEKARETANSIIPKRKRWKK